MSRFSISLAAVAVLALTTGARIAGAQAMERRAFITGGQPGGPGKCTIEVVVDSTAEVEIRGDSALLRTLAGQPAQWRRFQCTSPMPVYPAGFHFAGVDGRGRQQLDRDPGRGGPAVIRIDDPQNGSEGYTFDITWNGAGQPGPTGGVVPGFGPDRDRDDRDRDDRDRRRDGDRGYVRPFEPQEAVRACEDAVIDQALDRLRAQGVAIRGSGIDQGRGDAVAGAFEVRRGRDWDTYRFSCSVDFRERRIRSVDFDPAGPRR